MRLRVTTCSVKSSTVMSKVRTSAILDATGKRPATVDWLASGRNATIADRGGDDAGDGDLLERGDEIGRIVLACRHGFRQLCLARAA
jgi:hypothetical protein